MSSLLLTGAAGFTGRHFSAVARQAGYRVHALASDLENAKSVETEIAGVSPDYVVHLAAISAVTHRDVEALYRVNLFGTMNVLNALVALPHPPKNILLVSSANVYGNASQSPIEESACPAPVNHYAISKLAMEHMSATYSDRLPFVIVRPFNYTGVGHDERFVIPKIVKHFARHAPSIELGNLGIEREFNDVRAVCEIYLRLLKLGKPGQLYNVCSGQAISLTTVIETLERITGHELQVSVNQRFVRANEIHRLCGSPANLESCIGRVRHPTLEETLRWMLSAEVV
ncbi:GDP-mannose 4,6-dehydratase [Ferrovum sp.]|uniref:GDP-mannose 4,6-dehydratase n=1 Tax=Ferrovum sp. TaxID=2609467 RepID=UPI00261E34C9|nr:GDP-mannose 4,6-dehydratase [Ferrovum sp.]